MEEDIKEAIERLSKAQYDIGYATLYSQEEQDKDIEILIKGYKELEKENEEWQRAYQEEKDKQFELLRENKQLEEENDKYPIRLTDEGYRKVIQEAQDDVMGNIKELRKRNSEMITKIKQLEEENKKLKKYDIRNIEIEDDKILKSPSFTKKEIDLMNLGIALSSNFDKLFDDESEE